MTQEELQNWLVQKLSEYEESENYDLDEESLFGWNGDIDYAIRDCIKPEIGRTNDVDYGEGNFTAFHYFEIDGVHFYIEKWYCDQESGVSYINTCTKDSILQTVQGEIAKLQSIIDKLK